MFAPETICHKKRQIMVILFNKPYGVLSQFTPEGEHRALDEFGSPTLRFIRVQIGNLSLGSLHPGSGELYNSDLEPLAFTYE